jgi:predicted ABC-type ATPase
LPTLTVFAGPNGSGKSTLTKSIDFYGKDRLLDPDLLADLFDPPNPSRAAIQAGRTVLQRTAEYLDLRVDFAVETTLAGHGKLKLLVQAKKLGYAIHLVFIALNTPELCITRVRNRSARGGVFVPDREVRRPFSRSIVNAREAMKLADLAEFYDNSGRGHRIVLIAKAGTVLWRSEPLPPWLEL